MNDSLIPVHVCLICTTIYSACKIGNPAVVLRHRECVCVSVILDYWVSPSLLNAPQPST